MYARINFTKGVNGVSNKKQRDRARFLHAILVHMANRGQDHTQKMLALLLKSSPSTAVKEYRRPWLQTFQRDGGLSSSAT